MDRVLNSGIPHVGERIFKLLDLSDLVRCFAVSKYWKSLSENELSARRKVPFIEASKLGIAEVVQLLLEHPDFKSIDWTAKDQGKTAFHWACYEGRTTVVKWFLDNLTVKDIGLNIKDGGRLTGFVRACRDGRSDVVKVMLDHPNNKHIEMNIKDILGTTALGLACFNGQRSVVRLLLEHPNSECIDLNIRDNQGRNPFRLACDNGQLDMISLLMEQSKDKGIDLNMKDNRGHTALETAATCNDSGKPHVVKFLLENSLGTNLKIPTIGHMYRIKMRNPSIIRMFETYWHRQNKRQN